LEKNKNVYLKNK